MSEDKSDLTPFPKTPEKSTIGLIAILCAVILIIRYLPNGFSGLLLKKRSK